MHASRINKNNVRLLGNQQAKRSLLFAHGFGTDQTAWRDVVPAFADEYRIVLFDYVGANEQTAPYFNPQRYTQLNAFAEDVLDIIESLNLRDVAYVGHSLGGMTGLLAANQEPGWFSRLVLLNASPRYVNQGAYVGGFDEAALQTLFAQMEGNFCAWASGFAPLIMANPDRPHLAGGFAQSLMGMRPDIALAIARMTFYSDHRADVPHMRHPTLLLQAQDDPAVPPAVSYYLKQQIPNATLTFLEAKGHLPHISDPGQVVGALRAFLN